MGVGRRGRVEVTEMPTAGVLGVTELTLVATPLGMALGNVSLTSTLCCDSSPQGTEKELR